MNQLNFDLKLQLVEYLYNTNTNYLYDNFNTSWFKLFTINKDFYSEYLYNLRKSRYNLTTNEVNQLNEYMVKLPDNIKYPLINASTNGYLNVVKYLVQHGANTNVVNARNDLVLRLAAEKGHLAVVKYLLQNNADIHADEDEALRWAANNEHLDVVKYLVEHGANVSVLSHEQRRKYEI